jgi:hypothetical protein
VPWCDLGQGGGGPSGCTDDGFEDNDSDGAAHEVGGGTHSGLMICSGDDDYFSVSAGGGVSVTINFNHDEGDLDMELLQGATSIDSSYSTSNSETVTADGGGTYTVRVYGYQGAQAAYAMRVTVY